MADLRAMQSAFAASLQDKSLAADWIVGDAAHAQRRLAIYRANVAVAAARALGAAYPVARQSVGDEFFDALARQYLAAYPSTSGDLNDFGDRFPDFAAGFGPLVNLPWLPDLARLEWAVHRAHGAADAVPIDAAALAVAHATPRLHLADGTAVIESPWPVLRVWEVHQPGHDGPFAVDWTIAQCALVARAGLRVTATALTAGEAAFVRATLAGAGLVAAAEAALERHPDTDLDGLLQRLVVAGLVTHLSNLEDALS